MLNLTCRGVFFPTASASPSYNPVIELSRLPSASNRFLGFRSVIFTKPMQREPRQLSVFMLLEPSSVQPSSELKTSDTSKDRLSSSPEIPLLDASDLCVAPENSIERNRRRKAEQSAYLFVAIASSVGVTFLAAGAVYYRFTWQMQGGEVPYTEMFGTFSLELGAAVGMEFWASWGHRASGMLLFGTCMRIGTWSLLWSRKNLQQAMWIMPKRI